MSFGSGGFGNSNTGGGFGSGFGSTTTGFGANNNNAGQTTSLFGNTNNTTGGFGATNNTSGGLSGFGAKPATTGGFGAPAATSSAPGLFGSNTGTTGGFGSGGFGATNNASTGFGSSNTNTGGLFGQNKPATTGFGGATTGGSLFGGSGTTGGFGATNTTQNNAFGAASNTGGFGATNTTNTGGFGGGFGASTTATNNQGTAATPFQPFTEKDAASNQTSHYQSITMMPPYQGKSFEELRVEDYAQGRRFGNPNGQAGTFGQSTGFGGSTFGANNNTATTTGGGLFGNNNNTATTGSTGFGFGATNNNTSTTGGFGSTNTNTGGGLFGAAQNKPATSLFGNTTNTGTTGGFGNNTGNTGGGLFGGGGGFGANNNNQQQQTTGLFGANNQQQNKPALGGFGSNNTNTGFGANNNNTGTGLFGSSTNTTGTTGTGLFGSTNNQPQQQQTGGLFGASQNTGGNSLFGNTQNKPAGTSLFGNTATATNTGGGLFGSTNNQQQQQNTGFGANAGGGLFGNNNNQNKSGGLFGSSTTNTNTGGGLFGQNINQQQQQQQQQGGGLFGANNQQQNSLFGNNQNKPAGASLFGNTTTTNAGTSLFGGNNNQQQNQQSTGTGLFGSLGQNNQNQQQNNNSLFGNSFGGGQSQTPQQNQLHASLTMSPYGNDQLFSSLGQGSTPVGPLATPLNGARAVQNKTPSLLSSTRLNSPVYTPRASTMGRNGGYGLSYSTYGTPGSAYSVSLTPQQSSLLKPSGSLGSALTSRLAKSMSMNNLRGGDSTPRDGESLLRPTPGSASQRYLQSGNMRKLVIDRSLRTDLFAPPEQRQVESARRESDIPSLRKKVSFDNTAGQSDAAPTAANALVRTEDADEMDSPPSLFRAAPKPQNSAPEMQQVSNGASLTTVPEDAEPQRPTSAPATQKPAEKDIGKNIDMGEYWSKPSLKDLKNMSRAQLSKVGKLVVGRDGVGRIEFGPCDLTNTNLDDIFGKICNFRPRQVTVYPENASKPPMGKGLNVPSTIYLEKSWPRSHGGRKAVEAKTGPAYEKHLKRLRGTKGTEFVNYDPESGVWTFKVQHFTTYGFDEDSDEFTEDTEMEQEDVQAETSGLSEPPEDETMQSVETGTGELNDTFDFQKNKKRSQSSWLGQSVGQSVPGGFGESQLGQSLGFDEGQYVSRGGDGGVEDHTMSGGLGEEEDPFISAGGAVQAPSPGAYERHHSSMALDDDAGAVDFAEDMQDETSPDLPGSFVPEEPKYLRSILKPAAARYTFASLEKLATDAWEDQLQRTISPRKRDRQALRELQQSTSREVDPALSRSAFGQSRLDESMLGQSYLAQKSAKKVGFGASTFGNESRGLGRSQALNNHMDLMSSLWEQQKPAKKGPTATRGFENPYPKRPRLSEPKVLGDKEDLGSHDSMKPFFSNDGIIAYSTTPSAPKPSEPLSTALRPLIGEHREIRFAKWSNPEDINPTWFGVQKDSTTVEQTHEFPEAKTDAYTPFLQLASDEAASNEKAVWNLAHILFDSIDTFPPELKAGMTADQITQYEDRLKKEALGAFWSEHLANTIEQQLSLAQSPEEKALLHLTANNVDRACEVLVAAKDFKLATLVAQLPSDQQSRIVMGEQIQVWLKRKDWSEMSEPVRALYSLIAGQVCTVAGTGPKTAPEDRASSFCISEQFSLTWMQSFALRLFFGGHGSIAEAVNDYTKDLESGAEKVSANPSWQQAETLAGREDTLLGLLRLSVSEVDLELLFDAQTLSGSPFNTRVAWQLAMYFVAKGIAKSFPPQKLDQLTLNFATELEVADQFITAVWVLLHMRDQSIREKAIAAIINRNAAKIYAPGQGESNVFAQLTDDFFIPADIIWQAKAQHARAVERDANLQTVFLINAGAIEEAHAVLSDTLGPAAVIEEDYDSLRQILSLFQNSQPYGWEQSGQVFEDFVTLLHLPTKTKHSKEGRAVMERLSAGLEIMREDESNMSLEQRVAIVEMMRVLGEEVREYESSGLGRVRVKGDEMEVEDGEGVGMGVFERYQGAMGVVASRDGYAL